MLMQPTVRKKTYSVNFYKNFKFTTVTLITAITLTACQPSQPQKASYGKINGETMGTSYHISFELPKEVNTQDGEAIKATQKNIQSIIQATIDKELVAFNNELSTWKDDSIISKFNRASVGKNIEIGEHFYQVLKDSKSVYQQSRGAFDPTVKPIFELWGFGKAMRVDRLQNPPTLAEREQAKTFIDFDSISFNETGDNLTVQKTKDNIQIDFSAIAKGYGVDVIAGVLRSEYNINNYMVEIGGEISTSGINAKGKGWKIAIDAPILHSGITDRKLIATIRQPVIDTKSKNDSTNKQGSMHLATSGNYRNSIVFDGIRYSHTIDPITGNPVVDGAASVTVGDDSVALADAWATALTAMPYDKALKMANELDKAVMFVVEKGNMNGSINNDDKKEIESSVDDWQIVETKKMKLLRAGGVSN